MKKTYLKIGITLFLSLGVIAIILGNYTIDNAFEERFKTPRKYITQLKEEKQIPLHFMMTRFKVDNGQLYAFDYPAQQIVLLDMDGQELRRFGQQGEGPKETVRMVSFAIADDSYYAFDNAKNTISQISYSDSLIHHYKSPEKLERAIRLKDDLFLSKSQIAKGKNKEVFFEKIDISQGTVERVAMQENPLEIRDMAGWAYDGFFADGNEELIFYVCYLSDKILCFDRNGNYRYDAEFIYNMHRPEFIYSGDNIYADSKNQELTVSVCANKDNLFVLSNLGNKEYPDQRNIDVYSVKDGSYQQSYVVPNFNGQELPKYIYTEQSSLYALYENAIVKYSL